MGLEATMIVVDNSESSRNGDYVPSRWEAQVDAVNLIFQSKTNANPESSVGLMSMGGSGPEVLTTLTTNPGKVLDGLHRTRVKGDSHFYTGIMIAALALKHRQNHNQKLRIIVFTCSAINESTKTLTTLAKKMKKNSVNIDIVAFGDLSEEKLEKLRAFNETVNGAEGSHLEVIPPGPNLLSDSIITSPILAGEGGAAAAGGGGAGGAGGDAGAGNDSFEFGVDPSVDPELALVLRMSMEEEKERQERDKRAREEAEGKTNLETVPEGKEESQPLLDSAGEPSGSKKRDQKGGDDEDMDTA